MVQVAKRGSPLVDDDANLRAPVQTLEYRAIARRIAKDDAGRVLDWGCGWGQITWLLVREGVDVTAFDYRPKLARDGIYALERFPDIHAWLSSDPIRLPFAAEAFDAVLSCGVLEHVVDPDASLQEIWRVLRPGGTLYIYKLPNRISYLEFIARSVARLGLADLYYHGALRDDRLYSAGSTRRMLEKHGFRIDEVRLMNMLPLTWPGHVHRAEWAWATNRALARIPGLRLFATNIEAVARK